MRGSETVGSPDFDAYSLKLRGLQGRLLKWGVESEECRRTLHRPRRFSPFGESRRPVPPILKRPFFPLPSNVPFGDVVYNRSPTDTNTRSSQSLYIGNQNSLNNTMLSTTIITTLTLLSLTSLLALAKPHLKAPKRRSHNYLSRRNQLRQRVSDPDTLACGSLTVAEGQSIFFESRSRLGRP